MNQLIQNFKNYQEQVPDMLVAAGIVASAIFASLFIYVALVVALSFGAGL